MSDKVSNKGKSKIFIKNKKAGFEYEFIDKYTAGLVLTGTEIKSIRAGKVSLVDSYCYFFGNELFVKNINIADYWWGTFNRHDPRRDRKLLLNKRELRKLKRATREKGFTIVTTSLFISDNGYAKLNIALAKGKKEYDKRNTLKEKEQKRDIKRGFCL
ncbi:MAG: SsrA-binding protein SmpB [Bacteroidales bacterium]